MTCIFAGFALVACDKESDNPTDGIPEDAILLSTEGYSGDNKTSVSDNSVVWMTGDEVRIINSTTNDRTVTVDPSTNQAYIGTALDGSGALRGYYPKSIITADGAVDDATNPTIVVPANYESHYDASGNQVIALPMVASAADGVSEIQFKHVTAAVKVMVKNETGVSIVLDKVVVSSDHYKLSGTVTPNLTVLPDLNLTAQTSGTNDVSVSFADGPVIANNAINTVQVPILPINNDQEITIRVFAHANGAAWHKYAFSHHSSIPNNLTRNLMLTARVSINTSSGRVLESKFSVDNSKKVYFSLGNLQYIGSAPTPYWKFAEHQWDYLGTMTGQNSSDTDKDRDLFGWGTSGQNHGASAYQPYSTDINYNKYYVYGKDSYSLDYNNPSTADWGYNAISNGGNTVNFGWRTLSNYDWDILLNTRSGNKYAKGNIHSTNGIILFPDGFDPSAFGVTVSNINTANAAFTSYSDAEWTRMEDAGCIFLPAAGYRDGTTLYDVGNVGRYWTNKRNGQSNAYRFFFNASSVICNAGQSRHLGSSVRLVINAN